MAANLMQINSICVELGIFGAEGHMSYLCMYACSMHRFKAHPYNFSRTSLLCLSNERVKSAVNTDIPKRNDSEIEHEVLPVMEDLSVQAQQHGSASTSSEGGKQGEETFPSAQGLLDNL